MSNWQSNPGPSYSPYSTPAGTDPYGPKPSSPKLWLWLLLGFGGLAGLCCCGGSIGVVMFGMNVVTAEVADQLRDNPKFREHIGELQEMNVDWAASAAKDEEDTFIYTVKGDKGSGTITVQQITDDDGNEQIVEASLRLSDGRQVKIVP